MGITNNANDCKHDTCLIINNEDNDDEDDDDNNDDVDHDNHNDKDDIDDDCGNWRLELLIMPITVKMDLQFCDNIFC